MRKLIFNIACLVLCLDPALARGQEFQNTSPIKSAVPARIFNPSCLEPFTSPILKSGDQFEGATWNDPSVILDGNTLVMYASADHNFDQKIGIYRLISKDGIHWTLNPTTPVLLPTKGTWDSKSVETPSVAKFKDTYFLFYTGYSTSFSDVKGYKIGYAISKDGIVWQKIKDPLLKPTHPKKFFPNYNFNQYIVAEPGAVVFQNQLLLYFSATGADREVKAILETIGVISSKDGTTWSTPQVALKPPQDKFPRHDNYKGFSTPSAAVINGKVHVFAALTSDSPYGHFALVHAESPDGFTQWKYSNSFYHKDQFTWTTDGIRSPSVLQLKNNVHVWFAGHAAYTLGIGYARCSLNKNER